MAILSSIWPPIAYLRSVNSLPAASSVVNSHSRKSLRSAYRIVSIDDEPFNNKDRLKELGFNVGYYARLDDFDPGESPQIFLCDILGIEPTAKLEGVWTMKEIRRRYPMSPLIAYTHLKPADAKYQEARVIADDIVRKNNEMDEIIDVLDKHLVSLNNQVDLWRRIENFLRLRGFANKDISVIEHYFVISVEKKDPDFFWKKSEHVAEAGIGSLIREFSPVIAKTFITSAAKLAAS